MSADGEKLPNLPEPLTYSAAILGGYTTCLEIEKGLLTSTLHFTLDPESSPTLTPLICVRILGYLILYAPTDLGRANIGKEINSCADYNSVVKLGAFYNNYFIRCFKAAKGPTPSPSEHPSRPSFDADKANVQGRLQSSPANHQTAKTKALEHDGYRCVIKRTYDSEYAKANGLVGCTATACIHIFPESIGFKLTQEEKAKYASSLWTVMARLGCNAFEELNGPKVHCLENVMTMDLVLHNWFDSLEFYLEKTSTPNQYKPTAFYPGIAEELPDLVNFSTTTTYPLPDPRYIDVHATCAKVAHFSGAGKRINAAMKDIKESFVLASDGSSHEILNYALGNLILAF